MAYNQRLFSCFQVCGLTVVWVSVTNSAQAVGSVGLAPGWESGSG